MALAIISLVSAFSPVMALRRTNVSVTAAVSVGEPYGMPGHQHHEPSVWLCSLRSFSSVVERLLASVDSSK